MNRLQFWIVVYLSSLVAVTLLLQIVLVRITAHDQVRLAERQQFVQQGQQCDVRVRQLAERIYQVSQQSQDQGLKDLLARQQITIQPPAPEANSR